MRIETPTRSMIGDRRDARPGTTQAAGRQHPGLRTGKAGGQMRGESRPIPSLAPRSACSREASARTPPASATRSPSVPPGISRGPSGIAGAHPPGHQDPSWRPHLRSRRRLCRIPSGPAHHPRESLAETVGAQARTHVLGAGSTAQRVNRSLDAEGGRTLCGSNGGRARVRQVRILTVGRSHPVRLALGRDGLDLDDAGSGRHMGPVVGSGLAGDAEIAPEALALGAAGRRGWPDRRGHHRHQQGHCGGEANGVCEEGLVGHRHSNPR